MRKKNWSDTAQRVLELISWGAILAALFIVLPIAGLWIWTGAWSVSTLRWAVVVLPIGLVAAFALGFYFGKVEVRGFLGGFDKALDGLGRAVDLRDNARIRTAAARRQIRTQAQPAQNFNVYLPDPALQVPIRDRQLARGEVIDL